MSVLARALLVTSLLAAPLSVSAQERIAIPPARSDGDPVVAELLTDALREAALDAEDVRGAGPMAYDWVLRAEVERASADEEDRLRVSLRLVPREADRDERTLTTTMSPDEPPAHLRERARGFLAALLGTSLDYREVHIPERVPVETPQIATPTPDAVPRDSGMGPNLIAALVTSAAAASATVVFGFAQLEITQLNESSRWTELRRAYDPTTTDVCAAARSAGVYSADTVAFCDRADALEITQLVAAGVGAASLISAVTFFVLDANDDEARPDVAVSVSPEGGRVSVTGRF